MKKALKISMVATGTLTAIFLMAFAYNSNQSVILNDIIVELKIEGKHALITSSEIEAQVKNLGIAEGQIPLDKISLKRIKAVLTNNPTLKNTTVHKSVDGKLKIYAEQREPFVRIINESGNSFLLDKDGYKMPTLESHNPMLVLFTGAINESLDGTSIKLLEVNKELAKSSVLDEIFTLSNLLESSDFWKNQVEHIHVDSKNEFVMVPRVGNHKIIFGDISDATNKLARLEQFYKTSIGQKDWNKYATIDIRFNEQVVCKKNNY